MLGDIGTTAGVLFVAFAWLCAGWLPGYAIAHSMRPQAGVLRNALLAPLPTIAVVMLVAQALQAMSVPVVPWTVLPGVAGLVVVLVAASRHYLPARRGGARGTARVTIRRRDRRVLGAAVLVALALWLQAIRSPLAVLPNSDGAHHGLWASRIAQLGTIDPSQILAGDLATKSPTAGFYPLGLHLLVALIARATGIPVNLVFTVGIVLAAAVLLPLGTFVVARRLCPRLPMAAPIAGLVAVAMPWFPYAVMWWGGVPLLIAMCQVPIAIDAVWMRNSEGRAVMLGVLLGVSAYGLYEEHPPELLTAGVFGFIVTVARSRHSDAFERRRVAQTWALGAAILAAILLPQVHTISGSAEGVQATSSGGASGSTLHTASVPIWTAIQILFNPVIVVLMIVGIIVAVPRRWCRGWGWCLGLTLLLLAGTVTTIPIVTAATTPWYFAPLRVSYMLAYFEAVYAGVGAAAIANVLHRQFRRQTAIRLGAVRLSTGVIALAAALLLLPVSARSARLGYQESSLIGPDQRAAFRWLKDHTAVDERVLNQFSDGSSWMLALDGVTPLFGTDPSAPGTESEAVWGERWYLYVHARDIATDPRARAAAVAWNIHFVYVNSRKYDGGARNLLSSANLETAPGYSVAWRRGSVMIFRISPSVLTA